MRYYLERKDGRRVTFEVAAKADLVLVMAPGKEQQMSKAQARATWTSLVKGGAVVVECHDPEGHDGECCSCSNKQLALALEAERKNPHVRGGNAHDKREMARTARNVNVPADWDPIKDGPLPGTWAFTARAMVQAGLMSGDEADDWKDQMKDESMGLR